MLGFILQWWRQSWVWEPEASGHIASAHSQEDTETEREMSTSLSLVWDPSSWNGTAQL